MITAPLPSDEAERLAELRAMHVLDTPPEQRFDRLVNLARRTFDVPMAFMSLVDSDRQWFKAACGACDLRQTPRDMSLCGHAIMCSEPMIVPDLALDERFADNPLVVGEMGLRFYAGVPLKGPGGHNIGTLCIADRKPRTMSEEDVNVLREIAGLAQDGLNMFSTIEAQRNYMHTQQQLSRELRDAAEYVRTQLPEALDEDGVKADYVYISSSQLGGDMLGYHALDEHRVAIYLLDVTGHGVGSSLLSVSVLQGVRQNMNADDPGKLLTSLNNAFPMEQHHSKFITMWYGIYDRRDRSLRYSTAGHPPAILLAPGSSAPTLLGEPQLMLGVMANVPYMTEQLTIESGSRLYLYSDGAFEITGESDGQMLNIEGLARMLARRPALDEVLHELRAYQGLDQFTDDLSLVQVDFD